MLRQCKSTLASLIADGAYDRDPVYQAAMARQPRSPPEVVIPPHADAALGTTDPDQQSPRDRPVQLMADRGHIGWQRATAHGRRNHAETTMGRYNHLIGPKLRARAPHRTIREARPASVRH